jgi:hypothetical protein
VNAGRLLRDPWKSLLVAMTGAFWIFPLLLGGRIALYRAEALLLPASLLLPELPSKLRTALLVAFVAILVPMGFLFFRNILV